MAQLVIAAAGAAIGSVFGPLGAQIGWAAGSLLGASLGPGTQGPRLSDTKVQISSYGVALPITYGGVRLAGNIIWSTDLVESASESGGKGGPSVTTYSYSVSCAVAICEGPIGGIRRIWADAKLVYDISEDADEVSQAASEAFADYLTVYLGDETQLPSPTIEAIEGAGQVEAYRGTAYVVLAGLPLADYGNRVPNFTFETTNAPADGSSSEDLLPLMVFPWTTGGGTGPRHSNDGDTEFTVENSSGGALSTHTTFDAAYAAMLANTGGLNSIYYGYFTSGHATNDSILDSFQVAGGAQDEMGLFEGPRYVYLCFNVEPVNEVYYDGGPEVIRMCTALGNVGADRFDEAVRMFSSTVGTDGQWGHAGLVRMHQGPAGSIVPGYNDINSNCTNYPAIGGYFPVASLSEHARIRVERLPTLPPPTCSAGDPSELGLAEVQGSPSFCIAPNGTISKRYVYSRVAGSYRQLRKLRQDDGITAVYVDWYPLGPILKSTHPDFNNASFWAAEAAAAGITGTYGIDYGVDTTVAGVGSWSASAIDSGSTTLSAIVTDICARAGLSSGQIDVTALTDQVQGYKIARQMPARGALEALRQAYFFDGVENGSKIVFVKRGGATVAALAADDLGASESGDAMALVVPRRAQETELPAVVNVAYEVRAADYQVGTQQAQRVTTGSQQVVGVELPIVMTDTKAAQVADVLMVDAWQGRTERSFTTTRTWTRLLPTDQVTVNDGEFTYTGRIIDKTENGPLIRWTLRDSDPAAYTPNSIASTTSGGGSTMRLDGPMKLELMDLPALRDVDATDAGFYAAAAGYRSTYRGGRLYRSADDTAYANIQTLDAGATLGYATTVLGSFSGGNTVDEANTVTVELHSGSLASITRDQLLNSNNAALIGDELINFQRAVLVSGTTYTLSGLLRGRRGTEQHMSTHAVDDRFVLLTEAAVYRVVQNISSIGTAYYKGVAYGTALADAGVRTFENSAAALKPLSPVHLAATPDDSSPPAWALTWVRRGRIGGGWIDGTDVALGEASEAYSVDVTRMGVVISTANVASASATVAALSGDVIAVYQISSTVGRGFAAYLTIP